MGQKRVMLRRDAEEAFRWCASFLFEGPGQAAYAAGERDLSVDTRRLAMMLLCRHHFPGFPLPDLPEWTDVSVLARDLAPERWVGLIEHFPPFKEDFDPEGLVDAPTLSEMGFYYERLKDFEAQVKGNKVHIRNARFTRKRRGTFFTPLSICTFMVRRALGPALDRAVREPAGVLDLRIIDPSMGTGQFLLATAELLVEASRPEGNGEALSLRRRILETCLFGVDLDGENVEMARFFLGLYSGRSDPAPASLCHGDALVDTAVEKPVFGEDGFPERFFAGKEKALRGFDAIVGNPPYVAAKNESMAKYKPYLGGVAQLDIYLLFINKYAARKYLREGGGICFIVPDPLLLRGNAEGARYRLLEDLDLEFLLHIKGVFPKTSVANVIFLARRVEAAKENHVEVARIDTARLVRTFRRKGEGCLEKVSREIPEEFFRRFPRKEFRYLYTEEASRVLRLLDTTRPPRGGPGIVIRPLQALARSKGAIFRGEEVGKERLRSMLTKNRNEGYPVIIGGENISKYAIRDDGLYIEKDRVRKEIRRYLRHKILLQKSSENVVAALDDRGYVVPQSVYGILVDDPRIGYPFLLTQLNSRLINYFIHIMFTGYKMVQPQIELEDLKQLPVMVPEFDETREVRTSSLETAKSLFAQYIRTDDPGWILEYVDDYTKLGSRHGSAMVHDLIDFLGSQIITACNDPSKAMLPKERLAWLVDLVIYKVFGLGLEEIETVESFFGEGEKDEEDAAPAEALPQVGEAARTGPPPMVFGETDPRVFLEKGIE